MKVWNVFEPRLVEDIMGGNDGGGSARNDQTIDEKVRIAAVMKRARRTS